MVLMCGILPSIVTVKLPSIDAFLADTASSSVLCGVADRENLSSSIVEPP